MSLKSIVILLTMQVFCYLVAAQDIHFSQFWNSPLNMNPVNTGLFEGDYRFVLNHKNQWTSFTNAYSTFSGSVDAGFENIFNNSSKIGAGLQINNDLSGDGRLSTNQFVFSSSYSQYLDAERKMQFGIGIGFAYTFNSIDFTLLQFGSQYIFDQFDPFADPQEVWQFDKINYFGLNAGVNFQYLIDSAFNFGFGFSANNINRPGKSFYEGSEAYLPIRWVYNLRAEYNIRDDLWVEPYLLVMHQQKYKEILLGGLFRFDYNPLTFRSIYIGTVFRTSDAGVFIMGVDYQNVKLTMSYDINISKLSQISRGKGGVEFSLIYIIMKPRPFEIPYYRKCPDFI